jgi:hypothetical protein
MAVSLPAFARPCQSPWFHFSYRHTIGTRVNSEKLVEEEGFKPTSGGLLHVCTGAVV